MKFLVLITFFTILLFSACRKHHYNNDPTAMLNFSEDTLQFDTVFTGLGNSTKWIKIYNPYKTTLKVSSIRLGGGTASDFRVNIDGVSTALAEDTEIPPHDSLYIFVNVVIDPYNGDAIREDSLLFETNGNTQKVILQAYGWNAIYIGSIGATTVYSDTTVRFTNAKPYILFGIIGFENANLIVEAGAKIYMYGGPTPRPAERALIYIGDNSSIKVNENGTFANPVVFQTHRLEEDFQEFPYHHDGIYLSRFSVDNRIHNCIIRNATIGVRVDSLSVNSNPKLEIKNTLMLHMEQAAILGRTADVRAENCVFANVNEYTVVTLLGGLYDFKHCTMVNMGSSNILFHHNQPILSLRDYEVRTDNNGSEYVVTADGQLNFTNCIIYGTKPDEIEAAQALGSTANFNFTFDHCLIKRDTFSRGLVDCIYNKNPLFQDKDNYDFSLDSLTSPAYDAGINTSVTTDILNRTRVGAPDLGAYEWIP